MVKNVLNIVGWLGTALVVGDLGAGPELFAENSRVTRCDRRVIETAGINRDLVPAMK